MIGGSGTFFMAGNRTNCPSCGRFTSVPDGEYQLTDSVLTSFRVLTEANALRFQAVLAGADESATSKQMVVAEAKALDPVFGKAVALLYAIGGIPLLATLIGVYLQWSAMQDDNTYQDAVLSELRASNSRQEQLLQEMRRIMSATDTSAPPPYSQQRPVTSHNQPTEAEGLNRASRRRALKAEVKSSKSKTIKPVE